MGCGELGCWALPHSPGVVSALQPPCVLLPAQLCQPSCACPGDGGTCHQLRCSRIHLWGAQSQSCVCLQDWRSQDAAPGSQRLEFHCHAVFRLFGSGWSTDCPAHTEHGPAPLCFPAGTPGLVLTCWRKGHVGLLHPGSCSLSAVPSLAQLALKPQIAQHKAV